ncbi:MAG: SufD family Fe-S cluster assembly protein [Solirubrobacteraceae bacterium]|jgi:Fe-S cluster assembly protein SufD
MSSDTPAPRKPGASREATLNHALDGRGTPRMALSDSRALAREAYERLELPSWRRSGFWTTSLESLDLDAQQTREHEPDSARPAILADAPCAGVLVQRDASVVHVELSDELAERGVIFCSLDDAARDHQQLFERYYLRRLLIDRHKLEAASAAFWSGGAFLYVPPDLHVSEPFQIVYEISEGLTAQYAHTLAIGDRGSDIRLREYAISGETEGQSLHARQFELYLEDNARCRLAQLTDWNGGAVHDVSTSVVEVARDAYCHWLPALLGGALVHHHDEIVVAGPGGDMAFRGLFFSERDEHLDVFAVDLHETGPSGGDVHWRGAATGQSRASFEGLIKINEGAQQSHTYLQFHSMLLSREAELDAIPSVLVGADDVSASHGGTVGELDELLIFYMQSRGLSRPQAVRVIVEGFFEPLIVQLDDPHLEALIRERIGNKLHAAAEDIERYALAR